MAWNNVWLETVARRTGNRTDRSVFCDTNSSPWERPRFKPNAVSSHRASFVPIPPPPPHQVTHTSDTLTQPLPSVMDSWSVFWLFDGRWTGMNVSFYTGELWPAIKFPFSTAPPHAFPLLSFQRATPPPPNKPRSHFYPHLQRQIMRFSFSAFQRWSPIWPVFKFYRVVTGSWKGISSCGGVIEKSSFDAFELKLNHATVFLPLYGDDFLSKTGRTKAHG